MQALKAIFRSIGLLFLLGVLLILFYIAHSLLITPKQDQLNYIPKDAEVVLRIHSRTIIDKTFQSLLLDDGDNKLINDLYKKISQTKKRGEKSLDFGIDFKSDVVVFKMPYKTAYVIGFLVKLSDKDAFEKTIGANATAQQLAVTHNEVGLILNYFGKERKHEDAIEMQQLADNILSNSMEKQKVKESPESLISVGGKNYDLDFSIVENSIVFNGTFSPKNTVTGKMQKHLKEKGFHLAVSRFSELAELLPESQIDFMDFNFLGYGENSENGFPSIQVELLVGFTSQTDVLNLLKEKFNVEPILNERGDEITLMGQTFYFKNLDDRTCYIGSTKNPEFIIQPSNKLLRISGVPSSFFAYKTDSFLVTMLEINPKFHASKQLALKTKSVDVSMNVKKNKQVQVSGKLTFQEGTYPINEIIRFLMTANLIP
jgi:hypothetical protein